MDKVSSRPPFWALQSAERGCPADKAGQHRRPHRAVEPLRPQLAFLGEQSFVRLTWPDYMIVVAYLAAMVGFGLVGTRRERSDEEYFLVGRRMPWLAVGISIVSSMLSSITYLAEPGEVWKSGVTHATGKLLGIPFAMLIVWGFCIPFMMRFEFTSAYEYLEHRFGRPTRRFGAALFVTMVVLWMGLAVLVPSQVVEKLSGVPLPVVIVTVGTVVTLYTMLGGLRVVMWTDVVQVARLGGRRRGDRQLHCLEHAWILDRMDCGGQDPSPGEWAALGDSVFQLGSDTPRHGGECRH